MMFLRSGIGAKLVLGLLGVTLGVGGIAAGARFRVAHPRAQNRHAFAGVITQSRPHAIVVRTRGGQMLTIFITDHTAIRHNGASFDRASLAPGDILIGTVYVTPRGVIYATIIRVVRLPTKAQGP